MTRKIALSLIVFAAPALGGCALQAALLANDMAQYFPEGQAPNNAHLMPAATQACTKRAAQYGSVHIVDVGQHRSGRIVVGGSVTDAQRQRRTFECHFSNAVVSFKLDEILPAS
jgi:hypothetical protein